MSKTLRLKFYFLSFLAIFLVFFLFASLQADKKEDEKLIEHIHNVLLQTKKLFKSIKDSESSQRGYLLSENIIYLKPYNNSKMETYNTYENLRIMVHNDLKQILILDELKDNLDLKYDEMDQTIDLTKKAKKDLAMIIIQSDYGETYMNNMNNLIDKFLKNEDNLLAIKKQKFNFNDLLNNYLIQLILASSFILMIYFYFNNLSQKIKLENMNNELEEIVGKRTFQFLKLNKELEKRVREEVEENRKKDLVLLDQAKRVSLGEMMGNIAHQWRQPLNVISVTTSGMKLRNDLDLLSKEDFDISIERIMNNSKYLSDVIDTFRSFVQEDKIFKDICVENEIRNGLNILNSTLEHNFIKLINNINYSKKNFFNGYSNQLSEVIIIILNNAKDILLEKKVDDRAIILDKIDYKNKVLITVSDNGGGIKEEIIDRIFEPYFTTKHQSVGTGLGLYICKKIIEDDLKGKFYVKNIDGGAKFFIEIPTIIVKDI